MKGVGMFLVSLKGVNFGFWSHLGCSGQNAIMFSREGLVYGSLPRRHFGERAWGARFSFLPTNACSTEDNIPFPSLANHIVLSKFWKVDLGR